MLNAFRTIVRGLYEENVIGVRYVLFHSVGEYLTSRDAHVIVIKPRLAHRAHFTFSRYEVGLLRTQKIHETTRTIWNLRDTPCRFSPHYGESTSVVIHTGTFVFSEPVAPASVQLSGNLGGRCMRFRWIKRYKLLL